MKPSIGLKVWSTNLNYIKPAAELFKRGVYEFIELYAVPGSFKETASAWKALDIPVRLHAPHEINLSVRDKQKDNLALCRELEEFNKALKAQSVVVHPGLGGDLKATFLQMPFIKENLNTRILIENMPYISLEDDVCPGALFEDIKKTIEKFDIGFCFDICHATKAAIYLERDIKKFVERFIELKPEVLHLSDGHLNTIYDEHLSIGGGEFDFAWISDVVRRSGCSFLVLETAKSSKENLDDFARDARKIKSLFEPVALEEGRRP